MKSRDQKLLQESLAKCKTAAEKITAYYGLASRFYDEDQHADAIPLYREALKLEKSSNGKAYFLGQIGTCYYFLEDDRNAAAHLRKAKRAFRVKARDFNEEMYAQVHYYLGALYGFQGKPAAALKEQLVALEHIDMLDREYRWLLHTAISRSYAELGRTDRALRFDQKALDIISDQDPNLTYLYETMGDNRFDLGQFDEALKAYQKVLELDPRFERRDRVYSQIGQCYQNLTNYRSALDAYCTMLEVRQLTGNGQDLIWLHAAIAGCHFHLGEFAAALERARKGLKLRARDKQQKAHLHALAAASLYELGYEKQAVKEGDSALKLSSRFNDLDQFLFRMAMAHHKLGNTREFQRFRKRCQQSFPKNAWNKLLAKLS